MIERIRDLSGIKVSPITLRAMMMKQEVPVKKTLGIYMTRR
jgi:hypothetical protein